MLTNAANLAETNAHERDIFISFQEEGHKYTITAPESPPDAQYVSVTTWIHHQFPQFDADKVISNIMRSRKWGPSNVYWGKTPEEIKAGWAKNGEEASRAGTEMHFAIECFYNNPQLPAGYTHRDLLEQYYSEYETVEVEVDDVAEDTPDPSQKETPTEENTTTAETPAIYQTKEWEYFLQFVADHPELEPFRTEWMVYHEEARICGSIDMIYRNTRDGTLMIFDWKRAKSMSKTNTFESSTNPHIGYLPNSNYWHYALQLNTYKYILQAKYGHVIAPPQGATKPAERQPAAELPTNAHTYPFDAQTIEGDLYLIRLHPDAAGYEKIGVPNMQSIVHELFTARQQTTTAVEH